jgi:Fic family protein
MTQEMQYVWQRPIWPEFRWDSTALLNILGECRFQQGALLAQIGEFGFEIQKQAQAEVLIQEALRTSEIEGEHLDPDAVRSSVATRLGVSMAGLRPVKNRYADGMVTILLDATTHYQERLTIERLFSWHAALFPTGYSGLRRIQVAGFRDDQNGPMRVVSGPMGQEMVHYEAPPAHRLEQEMGRYLDWWEKSRQTMDGIIRAGIGHLWFVTVHPFEDGNGRIARTLTDTALAQDEDMGTRFYSLSSQIIEERDDYYSALEYSGKGDGDATVWLKWFLGCMSRSILRSKELLVNVIQKARFWKRHGQTQLNDRQTKVINRLLEHGPSGFPGGLNNRKYAGMAHTSRATAQRDLADLVEKGILRKNPGGGRSASYSLP